MKTANISDDLMLTAIRECGGLSRFKWASSRAVASNLQGYIAGASNVPENEWDKLVLSKAKTLIRRKLIGGCGCGCRGDFWVRESTV